MSLITFARRRRGVSLPSRRTPRRWRGSLFPHGELRGAGEGLFSFTENSATSERVSFPSRRTPRRWIHKFKRASLHLVKCASLRAAVVASCCPRTALRLYGVISKITSLRDFLQHAYNIPPLAGCHPQSHMVSIYSISHISRHYHRAVPEELSLPPNLSASFKCSL